MSKTTESPINIVAGSALEPYRRVKFGGTTWTYAGAGEDHDAVTCDRIASGDVGAAWPRSHNGTVKIEVAGAITAGSKVYPAASGKIASTQAGSAIGRVFMDAAATNGDVIEVLPLPRDANMFVYQVTCSNSQTDVVTGFAANPVATMVVVRTSAGVERVNSGNTVTNPVAGTVRVANAAMVNTDILTVIAWGVIP